MDKNDIIKASVRGQIARSKSFDPASVAAVTTQLTGETVSDADVRTWAKDMYGDNHSFDTETGRIWPGQKEEFVAQYNGSRGGQFIVTVARDMGEVSVTDVTLYGGHTALSDRGVSEADAVQSAKEHLAVAENLTLLLQNNAIY